jgi:hypothetical protein
MLHTTLDFASFHTYLCSPLWIQQTTMKSTELLQHRVPYLALQQSLLEVLPLYSNHVLPPLGKQNRISSLL